MCPPPPVAPSPRSLIDKKFLLQNIIKVPFYSHAQKQTSLNMKVTPAFWNFEIMCLTSAAEISAPTQVMSHNTSTQKTTTTTTTTTKPEPKPRLVAYEQLLSGKNVDVREYECLHLIFLVLETFADQNTICDCECNESSFSFIEGYGCQVIH